MKMSNFDWSSINFSGEDRTPHYLRGLDEPPVDEVCTHFKPSLSPLQSPVYRRGDAGEWIYYHNLYLVCSSNEQHWERCGKPEPWRWKFYAARCDGCGKTYSNPWVPVCADCWDSSSPYPSWEYVLTLETRAGYPVDNPVDKFPEIPA